MGRHDDEQVGRVLTRRQAVSLVGLPALSSLAGCANALDDTRETSSTTAPTDAQTTEQTATDTTATETSESAQTTTLTGDICVVKPRLNEGPFFEEEVPERADIRTDTKTGATMAGVVFDLTFNVYDVTEDGGCVPLPDAVVDIWHANVHGEYAGVPEDDTDGQDFLRGYQRTNDDGRRRSGPSLQTGIRAEPPHIHFKVRSRAADDSTYEFTSQLFFDDAFTTRIYERDPYSTRPERDTTNEADSVFQDWHESLLVDVAEDGDRLKVMFNVALHTDKAGLRALPNPDFLGFEGSVS